MEKEAMPYQMLSDVIGIPIKIISNEFDEFHENAHHEPIYGEPISAGTLG